MQLKLKRWKLKANTELFPSWKKATCTFRDATHTFCGMSLLQHWCYCIANLFITHLPKLCTNPFSALHNLYNLLTSTTQKSDILGFLRSLRKRSTRPTKNAMASTRFERVTQFIATSPICRCVHVLGHQKLEEHTPTSCALLCCKSKQNERYWESVRCPFKQVSNNWPDGPGVFSVCGK